MRRFLFLLLLPLLGLGCFHKDLQTATADDIVANIVYEGKEGRYVLSLESIFQASSKESNGGVTHISGRTELRFSSYELATGELAGRVELGDNMEEAQIFLGYSEGKVWMYSIDPELGLHFRDPHTLEVQKAWPQLKTMGKLGTFNPAQPEWALLNQYYGFDWEKQRVVLTDDQGFRYLLDPDTYSLEKTDAKMPNTDWDKDVFSNSGQFIPDKTAYLSGDPRKTIDYLGKTNAGSDGYLFGEFVLDLDPRKLARRQNAYLDSLNRSLTELQDSLTRFSTRYPEVNQEPQWGKWNDTQRQQHRLAGDIRRIIEDLQRKLNSYKNFPDPVLDSPLATGPQHSAFIRHSLKLTDTAHVVISRVDLQPDSTWKQVWSTPLPNIYQNYSKAEQAGAFEKVFSKGNPQFDYVWASVSGDYLLLAEQLRMVCLDMRTGKRVWEREL